MALRRGERVVWNWGCSGKENDSWPSDPYRAGAVALCIPLRTVKLGPLDAIWADLVKPSCGELSATDS
jgi:hypothetical protein